MQQPPGLLGADPARRPVRRRGRGGLGFGGGAREREPDRVPTVGVVAGAPGRGEARDEAQPAAVGRGPAVPAPGLGEVRFEGAGTAVGDGDGERDLVDVDAQLELGARVQHGVLGELAGQEHGGVGDFGVEAADGVEHLLQHPAGLPGRPRVGRQPDPPLQQGRHGCSVPGAARSRLRCLPGAAGAAGTGRATPGIRSTTLANRCRASSSWRAALAPERGGRDRDHGPEGAARSRRSPRCRRSGGSGARRAHRRVGAAAPGSVRRAAAAPGGRRGRARRSVQRHGRRCATPQSRPLADRAQRRP